MDEALVRQQAEAYKVAGVDEDAPALNPAQKRKEALLEDVSRFITIRPASFHLRGAWCD